MTNITLAIDEDLLSRARIFADRKGTTVNAIVREQLAADVNSEDRREQARKALIQLMETSTGQLEPDYKWNREELYEERMLPRHKHPDLRSNKK